MTECISISKLVRRVPNNFLTSFRRHKEQLRTHCVASERSERPKTPVKRVDRFGIWRFGLILIWFDLIWLDLSWLDWIWWRSRQHFSWDGALLVRMETSACAERRAASVENVKNVEQISWKCAVFLRRKMTFVTDSPTIQHFYVFNTQKKNSTN